VFLELSVWYLCNSREGGPVFVGELGVMFAWLMLILLFGLGYCVGHYVQLVVVCGVVVGGEMNEFFLIF
jgi:hypothetical protein